MSRSDLPKVRLIVSGGPGTDIWVMDGRLRTVAHSARKLDTELAPGLYKVKWQAGSATTEQMVELISPGAPVTLQAPELRFTSSVPLNNTGLIREDHRDNAARTSRVEHVHAGVGSHIFVFSRTISARASAKRSAPPSGQNPAEGLSLIDTQGNAVARLAQQGEGDLGAPDPWWSCAIALDPGPYRLRLDIGDETSIEQTVIASPGWQTQVFLLQDDYGSSGAPLFRADLESASILMARDAVGFSPDDEILRLTELARSALARQRSAVAADLLDSLLDMKYENPMLGLYAGHAIIGAREPDRALLARVVARLRGIIGDHPDLDAMGVWLGEPARHTYSHPPMFRRSWDIVVDRASSDRTFIPSGSMASGVGGNVWGQSVWLIWDADAAQRSAADPAGGEDDVVRIGDLTSQRVTADGIFETDAHLDDVDLAILSYAGRRSRARGGPPPEATPGLQPREEIAQQLNLPPSTVDQRLGSLVRKLEAPDSTAKGMTDDVLRGPAPAPSASRRYEVSL